MVILQIYGGGMVKWDSIVIGSGTSCTCLQDTLKAIVILIFLLFLLFSRVFSCLGRYKQYSMWLRYIGLG